MGRALQTLKPISPLLLKPRNLEIPNNAGQMATPNSEKLLLLARWTLKTSSCCMCIPGVTFEGWTEGHFEP